MNPFRESLTTTNNKEIFLNDSLLGLEHSQLFNYTIACDFMKFSVDRNYRR